MHHRVTKVRRDSSSPASSPSATPKKLQQSLLAYGLNDKITCNDCGMTYLKNLKSDIKQHHKYHEKCVNGRDWNDNWGELLTKFDNHDSIVRINPLKQAEVNAALDLLEIVNSDLNAPDDNDFWLKNNGYVYIYVRNKVAIGIVSVIKTKQGKWFSIEDGKIVNDQILQLQAGISRIYVCSNFRRDRIGYKLLECIQNNLVYGMKLPKLTIGWSQPSSTGGKLAASFNGVKHKSGKTLIPIYIESHVHQSYS